MMRRRWAQDDGPVTGPPEGAIEMLLVAHTMQLSEDTQRGRFEGPSYKRAMFSAFEGNQSFIDEQKVIAEELKSLRGANVQPLKSSDLPVVEMTEKPKSFTVKPDAGEMSSGDQGAKYNAIGTDTLAGHLTPSADKEVGYYRVGLVSYEGIDLVAAWDGQFLCKMDPRKKIFEMLLYKFKAEFSDDCLADLKTNNLSPNLKTDMRKNLSRYELSRQFLINLPLSDIKRICLNAPNGKSGHGFLIIECTSKVKFAQRHIATNLSNQNQWKQRGSIFSGKHVGAAQQRLIIGSSNCRDLAVIVAEIMLMEPKLNDRYVEEDVVLLPVVSLPGVSDPVDGAEASTSAASRQAMTDQKKEGPPKKKFKIFPKKAKQRKEILDMLVLLNIVPREKADEVYASPQNLEDDNVRNKSKINNFLGGLGLETCFNEYLNFKCESADDLESMVHQKLNADDRGFYNFQDVGLDSYDDDSEDEPGDEDEKKERAEKKTEEFSNLTALDLLQKQDVQGDPVFFSYCWGYIAQEDCSFHCNRCHTCRDWRMWHCFNCDNCSYGQSIPKCNFCGVRNDEFETCGPSLNGGAPVVRPAFEKEKKLKGTLNFFQCLFTPMHNIGDSDDGSDEDGMYDPDDYRPTITKESRRSEEDLKGWVFSDTEDDVLPSPLDI